MKKYLTTVLALICVLTMIFAFASCGKKETVSVKLPSAQTGYTVSGADTAEKGGSYEFTVTISDGYKKGDGFRVTVNGTAVTEADGKYVVENVSEDLTIAVEGVVEDATDSKNVTVTLPKDPVGYTVSGNATAEKGGNYEFTVTISAGYKKGDSFRVTVNGTAVTETDGKYVVENVAEDLTIAVEGVVEDAVDSKNVTVTFPKDPTGYTVSGNATAEKGGSYEFTVTISNGYEIGDDFAVKVNGKAVTAADGKYTVENVSENLVIEVTGVKKKEGVVTVTLPSGQGYTVSGETTAVKGSKYEFTVTISKGYKAGEDFEVTANGRKLTGNNGKYVIENIQSNTVIEVAGVEESNLSATFTAQGFNDALLNVTESFTDDAENYTFKIELSAHYTQCADSIKVYYTTEGASEKLLTPDANGVYTIPNPHKDIKVIVKNVSLNKYTVSFFKNAVEKYSIEVEAKSVLTTAQLDAAKKAILGNGEKFVAWREDVTKAITDDTSFSAYTRLETAFGEEIVGSPLTDGTSVTLGENEYSAAGGFEKIYTKVGATTGIFADIDLSKYSEIRFAFKLDNSYVLFGNWANYVDVWGTWVDVVMENTLTGKWKVTVTGPVNHNEEGGSSVLKSYTAEYDGKTLSQILTGWYTDDATGVSISVTELRGTKVKPYGEVISEVPAEDFTTSTDITAPADFGSVYHHNNPKSKKFADIDISKYSEVKFYFALDNMYFLINGWGAYVEAGGVGANVWVPVTLTNNGSNSWTITVAGKLTGGSVTDTTKYTYNATGSTLKAVLGSWFADIDSTTQVYLTEIRGIKMEIKLEGEIVEGGVLKTDVTEDTTETVPAGFEKVYKVEGTFDQDKKNDADLSKYSTVKFALKSKEHFLISGWSIYLKESQTDWVFVTMTNKGDNTWEVSVAGDVWNGSANAVENPWTHTYTGNSISTILKDWYNGKDIYVTELRGITE